MKCIRRITALLAALWLMCLLSAAAYAHEVPDMTRRGTITVEMRYDGKAVTGGTLAAYRVAAIAEEDGDYRFQALTPYIVKELTQENLNTPELAEAFAEQVKGKGIEPAYEKDGVTRFDALTPGLYLIVQTEAAPGYSPAAPFLVSVPFADEGQYEYAVDATVKAELTRTVMPSPTPGPTASPGPSETKLPQTGQLNWPVPVLTVLGLGVFTVGWVLRFGKKKDEGER